MRNDCSANNDNTQNDNIFSMTTRRDPGDTASLRCAARGPSLWWMCQFLTYDPAVGYTVPGSLTTFPTARPSPNLSPTSRTTSICLSIDVQDMIDSVNWVKGASASQQISCPASSMAPLARTTRISRPLFKPPINTGLPRMPPLFRYRSRPLWDYMPICWDPAQTSADGNIYKAYGGLRLKTVHRFLRRPRTNLQHLQLGLCQCPNSDWKRDGSGIEAWLASNYPLIDTDPITLAPSPTARLWRESRARLQASRLV